MVQERDGLGDNLPSDYLTRVQQGGFYGWPYAYIGPHPRPGFAQLAPDKVKETITPDLLFNAHSSVLDLVFTKATSSRRTSFWAAGERRAEVWGRPTALAVAKDGALLVADDTGGTIWRIAYTGPGHEASTPPQTNGSGETTGSGQTRP